MKRMLTHGVLHVIVVLILVSFATTFMLDLLPGHPAFTIYGENATPEQVARVTDELGLDKPFYERYWDWSTSAVRGDLGVSYHTQRSVGATIIRDLGVTLQLAVCAIAVALAISIPIGIYTARHAGGRFDKAWESISSILISTPHFVSSLILVYALALQWNWLTPFRVPVTGWVGFTESPTEWARHMFLPVTVLALAEIPRFSRLLQADMVAVLQEDYILSARTRGVPTRRILLRHALRPSSFSLVTVSGLSFASLMSGAVIVETLFAIPGLGRRAASSVLASDVVMVQGIVLLSAVVYVVVNALIEALYGYLDPRVRQAGGV